MVQPLLLNLQAVDSTTGEKIGKAVLGALTGGGTALRGMRIRVRDNRHVRGQRLAQAYRIRAVAVFQECASFRVRSNTRRGASGARLRRRPFTERPSAAALARVTKVSTWEPEMYDTLYSRATGETIWKAAPLYFLIVNFDW